MSKARPYRTIDEVLEELGVPNKQRFRLREATREIVDQHRAKDPEQMKLYLVGDVLPLPLASEFLMKHGGMIFNNKGELRWEGPKDFDVLRTGFAHIIGRQNIQRQEKLTREGSAPQKRPRQDNEDGTAGSTTSERVLKLQRRDAGWFHFHLVSHYRILTFHSCESFTRHNRDPCRSNRDEQ